MGPNFRVYLRVTDGIVRLWHGLDTQKLDLPILHDDAFVCSALVRQGLVPCSPISPTTVITIEALEFYRVARNRNPHFSIQAFVKTICDLQEVCIQTSYIAPLANCILESDPLSSLQVIQAILHRAGRIPPNPHRNE